MTTQLPTLTCYQQIKDSHMIFYQDSLPIKNNMYPRKGCKCIEKRGKHVVKLLKSSMIKACECDQSLIITRIKQGNKWWPFWRLESSIWNLAAMVPHPIIIQHFLERIVLFLSFLLLQEEEIQSESHGDLKKNLLYDHFLHSWRAMKYWYADLQFCNSIKLGYAWLNIHMQKSI